MTKPIDIIFLDNLTEDIEQIYKKLILEQGLKPTTKKKYFFQYMNFIERIIPQKPRQILESSLLKIPTENKAGFEQLKNEIIKGNNINIYQSNFLYETKFIDKLFTFENIVHFHLGTEINRNKFNRESIKRTSNLLIALVTPEIIYFLSIQPHGNKTWLNHEYLEILANEFPAVIEKRKSQFKGDTFDFETIEKCRKLGINYSVETNNKSAYINMPIMLGTSPIKIEHRVKADKIFDYVNKYAEQIKEDIRQRNIKGKYEIILVKMTREPNGFPDELTFKIIKDNEPYGEYEIQKEA